MILKRGNPGAATKPRPEMLANGRKRISCAQVFACTSQAMMARGTNMEMGCEHNSPYPVLAALLEGDDRKIKAILRVFHLSASKDLQAMQQAAARGQWFVVLRLSHRISIGCRQIGAEGVAEELLSEVVSAIEFARASAATGSISFMRQFQRARHGLIEVLDSAAAYAATEELDSVA